MHNDQIPVRMVLRADAHKPGDNCSAFMYLSSPEVPVPREDEQW